MTRRRSMGNGRCRECGLQSCCFRGRWLRQAKSEPFTSEEHAMKTHWITGIVVLAAATGVALAQDSKKTDGKKGGMAKGVSVSMHAQNKSGETGTAKLTPEGADKTRVEITLKGGPKGTPQPAHIHEGSC